MITTRIKEFTADAEVLGHLREVSFSSGAMVIRGLSLEDCYRILKALSNGALVSVEPTITVPEVARTYVAPPRSNGKSAAAPTTAPPVVPSETAKETAPPPSAPAGAVAIDADSGLPEGLVGAKTLKAALVFLIEQGGCSTADKLLAEAMRVRDKVPVMRVSTDLEDRVKRAAELFLGGAQA